MNQLHLFVNKENSKKHQHALAQLGAFLCKPQ